MVRTASKRVKESTNAESDEAEKVYIVPLSSIRPATVNDSIYRPPNPDDANMKQFAANVREFGQLQPAHVVLPLLNLEIDERG